MNILKNWKLLSGAGLTIAVIILFFLFKDAYKDKVQLQEDKIELTKERDKALAYVEVMQKEYNKLSDSKSKLAVSFTEHTDKIILNYEKKLQKKPKIVTRYINKDAEGTIADNTTTDTETLSDSFKTDILTMDFKIHYRGEIVGTEFYPTVKQKIITKNNIVYETKFVDRKVSVRKDQFGLMYSYGFSNNMTIHDFNVVYKSKTNLGANFGVMLIDNKALENDIEYVPKVGVSIWF